jgi:L-threonylcarbamoyladenylate synthase
MALRLDLRTDSQALAQAAHILDQDGLVVIPTETFYGIAARADRPRALRRLTELKGRAASKAVPLIAATAEIVRELAVLPPQLDALAKRFWPGPLTLALTPKRTCDAALLAEDGTLGIRVSGHAPARALAALAGGLVTATSANLAGEPPARTPAELDARLLEGVDAWLDGGACAGGLPSTVVGLRNGQLVVFREGAVAKAQLGIV